MKILIPRGSFNKSNSNEGFFHIIFGDLNVDDYGNHLLSLPFKCRFPSDFHALKQKYNATSIDYYLCVSFLVEEEAQTEEEKMTGKQEEPCKGDDTNCWTSSRSQGRKSLSLVCELVSSLTRVMLNCLFLFFIHSKLELLTQFPASNDYYFLKIICFYSYY